MGSGCSSSSKSTFSSSTNNPQTKSCSSLGNGAGEQRVTWELRTEDELVEAEGPCVGSTGKVEAMDKGICRSVETDEELQILDDLLAESQDCLSWKTSTFKAQMLTSTGHTTSPQANLCGGKKHNSETIWIAQEPAQLPPASSPCQNSNFRQCMKDTSSKPVVITRNHRISRTTIYHTRFRMHM
ncbi:hypothetical protein GDO86_010423 [Hymenochirus boettgeri]|uniref:Uncharacterized protein n=1 Tax=Hymenochirus boettgeri TaxID=247094 RepID=A0A8T2JTD1_9PIPI|nr:hypothetical protein GDO86_010423 [Hymenochirus boettgeri]